MGHLPEIVMIALSVVAACKTTQPTEESNLVAQEVQNQHDLVDIAINQNELRDEIRMLKACLAARHLLCELPREGDQQEETDAPSDSFLVY